MALHLLTTEILERSYELGERDRIRIEGDDEIRLLVEERMLSCQQS